MPDPFIIPPGAPATAPPPADRTRTPSRPGASGLHEFVAGSPNYKLGLYAEALPWYIDDVTRDFGDDVYERMGNDAQCHSCVEILKLDVLGEGYSLQPAVEKPQHQPPVPEAEQPSKEEKKRRKLLGPPPEERRKQEEYELASEVKEFCEDNLDALQFTNGQPFEMFLYEMMDGLPLGSKLAEKVFRDDDRGAADYPLLREKTNGRALLLDRLKPKPRRCVRYVVNSYMDLIGVMAVIPGRIDPPYSGPFVGDPAKLKNVLPREKFVHFCWNPKDNDPRGHSVYRPAYDPWWNKTAAKPEFAKYLAQFGAPSLFGTTPEDAEAAPPTDELGNLLPDLDPSDPRYLSPERKLLKCLQMLRNGYAAVAPAGTNLQVIQAGAGGSAFLQAFDWYDKQIAKAILGQTLATEEGEHQARAAAETHKDVLDIVLRHVRRAVATMIRNDILFHLVKYNYGEAVAQKYTPRVTVGTTPQEDFAQDSQAVVGLLGAAGGQFIKESQYWYFYEKLGIPPPPPEEKKEKPPQLEGFPPPQAPGGLPPPQAPGGLPPPGANLHPATAQAVQQALGAAGFSRWDVSAVSRRASFSRADLAAYAGGDDAA
jgi:hypothetical protein